MALFAPRALFLIALIAVPISEAQQLQDDMFTPLLALIRFSIDTINALIESDGEQLINWDFAQNGDIRAVLIHLFRRLPSVVMNTFIGHVRVIQERSGNLYLASYAK